MRKHKKIVLFCLAVLFTAFTICIIWANKALELNSYTVSSEKLPDSFSGYRIAHVSDLHNVEIGKSNNNLLSLLDQAQPDMIAITGDLIDSRNTHVEIALDFVKEAIKIAPCYYVTGNHEARIEEYNLLKKQLEDLGVTVLEDSSLVLEYHNDAITLIGVNDPSFQTDYLFGDSASVMDNKLRALVPDDDSFCLLLSHRPELFQVYADNGVDLVFSGHAHGGQVRIPFIGGLFAPNQGFLPEYDAGLYSDGNTQMLVSRGIGNSLFPVRLNNRPEVILIELN